MSIASCANAVKGRQNDLKRLSEYLTRIEKAPTNAEAYLRRVHEQQDALIEAQYPRDVIRGKAPSPIPGRLIVEIAPKDVATTFIPDEAPCDKAALAKLNVIPPAAVVARVQYVATAGNGRLLFRVFPQEGRMRELSDAVRMTRAEAAARDQGVGRALRAFSSS